MAIERSEQLHDETDYLALAQPLGAAIAGEQTVVFDFQRGMVGWLPSAVNQVNQQMALCRSRERVAARPRVRRRRQFRHHLVAVEQNPVITRLGQFVIVRETGFEPFRVE